MLCEWNRNQFWRHIKLGNSIEMLVNFFSARDFVRFHRQATNVLSGGDVSKAYAARMDVYGFVDIHWQCQCMFYWLFAAHKCVHYIIINNRRSNCDDPQLGRSIKLNLSPLKAKMGLKRNIAVIATLCRSVRCIVGAEWLMNNFRFHAGLSIPSSNFSPLVKFFFNSKCFIHGLALKNESVAWLPSTAER